MATNLVKHISKIAALTFALLSSAHALECADVLKLVAELKSEDSKVRANAITKLSPLYAEMMFAFTKASMDRNPDIQAAIEEHSKIITQQSKQFRESFNLGAVPLGHRLNANESMAVGSCKAYCTAQDIYRRTDYNKDGVLEYAQALKGKDSLYETVPGTGDLKLIDISFADAEGNPGKAKSKSGYCFKVLTKQGANAPGGARSFIKNGHMTFGYALLAYPAEYGITGKNCFVVSNAGTIYRMDLGAETLKTVETLDEFNPDKTSLITD